MCIRLNIEEHRIKFVVKNAGWKSKIEVQPAFSASGFIVGILSFFRCRENGMLIRQASIFFVLVLVALSAHAQPVKKLKKGGDTRKLQYEILADVCNLTGFYFFSKVS